MSDNEASVNVGSSEPTSSRGKKKNEYSVKFKLQENRTSMLPQNTSVFLERMSVDGSRRKRSSKSGTKKGGANAKNLPGGGRPVKNKDFEKELNDWVKEGRAGRHKVTRDLIVARAKQLQEKLPEERRLNLSHGWLESFMKRNKWTLRAPTSVAQKPPADYLDRVVKFVIAVEAMRKQHKFQSKHVYGADETGAVVKQLKLQMVLHPAGCTRFVQPADVSWKAPFKRKLRSFYEQWVLDGDHQTTAAGNPKPPPPETYLQWVLDAWEAVSEEVIIRSFKACGISTALDGSEDALVHCLKEGNGMPNGVGSLMQARHEANAQDLEEIMHGLELEAPEDPEDDAADIASDVSVVSGGEGNADESVDEADVEESDSDSDF
ncbi:pogo transposable element with KRAB domain-like protein [Aphelenchoides avenae]|nr:pogo transposable element with KRAB domain-like protein [Aphelenchus avenae]